jgi:glycosyltransferase involved in cell wall biosynthesis
MRILFFNEGNLGTHILGQAQLDAALRVGLSAQADVEARFAGIGALNRWQDIVASRAIEPLAKADLDFRTLRWHLVQSLRARSRLTRELRAWPADVVHIHSQSIALTMARLMHRLPVVVSVDVTIADWAQMPAWASEHRYAPATIAPSVTLERRALKDAALVLAWNEWTRRNIELHAPGAKVIVHHPGLDLEHYRPAPRRARERLRVLFVGGRFRAKGGEDLLQALQERLGVDVELDLVTPEPVPQRAGVRVHRLGPSDPRLLDMQQQADLLCLPTYGDSNPWVLLEAMACGTPVLSTRVGAIPELLDDGRAGVLVDHGDQRALREALGVLLADSNKRAQLAERALELCRDRFDARRQFARLTEQLRALS